MFHIIVVKLRALCVLFYGRVLRRTGLFNCDIASVMSKVTYVQLVCMVSAVKLTPFNLPCHVLC